MSEVRLVPLKGHQLDVSQLFWENMLIGHPLPFELACKVTYEKFCLDWYLNNPHHSVVAMHGNNVVGYALVCADQESYEKVERRNIIRLTLALIIAVVSFRINRLSLEFYVRRLRDSLTLLKSRHQIPDDVDIHAHVNIDHAHHNGTIARMLRDHVDARCIELGRRGWFGEMNAVGGSRVVGLQRVVGTVVSVDKNHTFTWLMGEPVSRLTTVRTPSIREAA